MVLAIIAFAIEVIMEIVVYSMGANLTAGLAWFTVVLFALCTIVSIFTLVHCIKGIKDRSIRGKSITGTVFSALALTTGSIFCISFVATILSQIR